MFSTALCESNAPPNTHANFVDLALPGMLPVLNEYCLNQSIKASLALGGRILPQIKFDRKHYTFCDLPQAYQITQKHFPIMLDGRLFFYDYKDQENYILIERMQMEQVSQFFSLQTHLNSGRTLQNLSTKMTKYC